MRVEATVVLSRCAKTKKLFGMRVEKRENKWTRTWAFPVDESKAKREKFDENKVTIGGADDPKYPGCPYCKESGFVLCSCNKLGCWSGADEKRGKGFFTCPWCGNTSEVETVESINASGGGF